MSGEKAATVKAKAVVDEGFGVAGTVGCDHAKGFTEERKAGGARWEVGKGIFSIKEEEEDDEECEEEEGGEDE